VSRQIFVSYSRNDAEIVRPLAHLLRATNDWVFLDSDSIRAGKKWRDEIDDAISSASLMIVFWCEHAERSDEVKREYAAAITTQKDILPVRLDRTVLPYPLSEFQALDFYDFASRLGHHGPRLQQSATLRPWHVLTAAVAVVLLSSSVFWFTTGAPTSGNTPATSPLMWLLALVVAAVALTLTLRLVRRQPSLPAPTAPAPGARPKSEAEILQEEVRRRLGLLVA
jgi:hypothetical protein